ncbi:MAG: 50S ribosomal protein L11 methyltransferase [Proteobacteria bacterium]|nr:50S ribosomal protein L11 methyltransferase [Pseudomonadota bacterium]
MSPPLGPGIWRISVPAPARAAGALADALASVADSVSWPEMEGRNGADQIVLIEAYAVHAPAPDQLDGVLREAAAAARLSALQADVAFVPARDWLAENRRAFPPVAAGRFHVRGTHETAPAPAGATIITLDAATAFGSGTHGSTRGCLLALDGIGRQPVRGRGLDLGCGSGILAIAMAAGLGLAVVASDTDPEAVRVTTLNAKANRVARSVKAVIADGVDNPLLRDRGSFAVVCANILAKPLIRMARGVRSAVSAGGWLVLSGLLETDEARIQHAYRGHGLRLSRRIRLEGWSTLVFRRALGDLSRASFAVPAGRV